MNVLILGSSGFIGSEVSLGLVRNGYKVYGLTRKQESVDQLLKNEIIPIMADVKDVEKWLPIALKVDIIIDTIADLVDYTTPFKVQEALFKVHKEKPNTIFIYTSGTTVYGGNQNLTTESTPYISHKFVDWRVQIEQGYQKIGSIIIQPTILYGKNQSFSGYFFEAATKSNDLIRIYGDENLIQGFIHIHDLVKFYQLVVKNALLLKGQTLIANSYSEKIKDLVLSISKFTGNSNKSIEYIPKSNDNVFTEVLSFNQNLSFSKSTQLIGYYPSQPRLIDDIERYYNSWLLLKDNNTSISKLIYTILP
ncbi:hypothetical protein RB653_007867 [Dictyostelium firmibasis]|uniref:NAD-dependent epimerase/dehydratase domain-containing protein n=1 Tax=Dictyostelium firmibasis TaxID=79012 RepID=A0AAN7U5B5_9MYCE